MKRLRLPRWLRRKRTPPARLTAQQAREMANGVYPLKQDAAYEKARQALIDGWNDDAGRDIMAVIQQRAKDNGNGAEDPPGPGRSRVQSPP